MKKMTSLFVRDYIAKHKASARNEYSPGTEWVQAGLGFATVKLDGTCCMIKDGALFKRYDAKHGKQPPAGFIPCQESPDPISGHWPGWLVVGDEPESRWHREAFAAKLPTEWLDGTYELVGPKIAGNKERFDHHELDRHGAYVFSAGPPRDFEGLKEWFQHNHVEGIVWHSPTGEMVKIKRSDFGMEW